MAEAIKTEIYSEPGFAGTFIEEPPTCSVEIEEESPDGVRLRVRVTGQALVEVTSTAMEIFTGVER